MIHDRDALCAYACRTCGECSLLVVHFGTRAVDIINFNCEECGSNDLELLVAPSSSRMKRKGLQ